MDLLTDGIEFVGGGSAIVTRKATTRDSNKGALGKKMSIPVRGSRDQAEIMGWGPNNDLPNYRERLIAENNIAPALLAVRRDITIGQGIFAYRKRYENGERIIEEVEMGKEQQVFFDQLEAQGYWEDLAGDFIHHGMVASEFVREKGMENKIVTLEAKRMRHLRAEHQDDAGKINHWYFSGQWGHREGEQSKKEAVKIPVYDPSWTRPPANFIFVTGDGMLCLDEYYYTPSWWGSEEWIRLANCIPEFHQSNLSNGYALRWHIEIPKGYFAGKAPKSGNEEDLKKAKSELEKAKKKFIDDMDKLLKGANKAGRSIFTTYEINKHAQKAYPGIKITPLSVDLKDEALLKLFEKSNQAVISAQGVHPTLANIETQGKLSSGTEIRNAYLMYLAIKTPLPRKILLRAINIVKQMNKWPAEIHYGFRDMVLAPLNDDKSGAKEEKSPAE